MALFSVLTLVGRPTRDEHLTSRSHVSWPNCIIRTVRQSAMCSVLKMAAPLKDIRLCGDFIQFMVRTNIGILLWWMGL